VDAVLRQHKTAVVITQPYLSDLHVDQQLALAGMMRQRYAGNPRVVYLNLGRAIDMRDKALVYDSIHLVPRGNELIASRINPVLWPLVERQAGVSPK
jgi:hypothetical protein